MPSEKTRTIVQIGNSLGVTLPPGWLRYYKLKVKDRVKVTSNSVIVIEPLKQRER